MLVVLTKSDNDSIYAICQTKIHSPQQILVSDVLATDLLAQSPQIIAKEICNHLCPYLTEYSNVY